jgi:hypothetical protein
MLYIYCIFLCGANVYSNDTDCENCRALVCSYHFISKLQKTIIVPDRMSEEKYLRNDKKPLVELI